MSRLSLLRLAFVVAMVPLTGCWEQWSDTWWPQMKWQRVVQAFELQGRPGEPDRKIGNFNPPDGTIPVNGVPKTTDLAAGAGDQLPNPKPATLQSLANGKVQFEIYCGPCHGLGGLGDGTVAGPPYGKGPLIGVLPIAGPIGSQITKNFSDGHIYTVISQGIRRMPAYRRIPPDHRWDIVNYVRYLNGQPAVGAQTAQAATPQQQGGAQP